MCPPGQMVCCGPMLNRRRILRRRSGPCGGSGLWLLKSKIFRGRPVSKRYSAFSTPLHPIPLPTLQNAAGGPFWAVLAAFCGDFDAGCVVVCCAGAGRASSIHVIGLLDVRVLEVLDVFLKNGCWMFLKALRSWIRMRSKCCASGC